MNCSVSLSLPVYQRKKRKRTSSGASLFPSFWFVDHTHKDLYFGCVSKMTDATITKARKQSMESMDLRPEQICKIYRRTDKQIASMGILSHISVLLMNFLPPEEPMHPPQMDIVSGLSCLFEEGHFCGSLRTSGVSIRDGRAKILIAGKAISIKEFEDGVKIDLRDLHDLMVYSLTLANSGNVPNAQYFEAQHIGKDVLNFLGRLSTLVHFEKVYVLWALDHPVFWTPALKTKFILKLWEKMSGVRKLSSKALDEYLQSIYDAFPKYLTMNAYLIEVKEYCEVNNEETYTKVRRSDSFEIVRIYRGSLYHYNRFLYEGQKERIDSDEISTIADTMLKVGVCTELTNAVGYAWRKSKDDGMRELMEYFHSRKAGLV